MAKDHTSTLVHEIEETRERLAGTIDELLVRSNPKNIVARQVGALKARFVEADSGKPNVRTIGMVAGAVIAVVAVLAALRKLGSR
jgi:hypothetical protein